MCFSICLTAIIRKINTLRKLNNVKFAIYNDKVDFVYAEALLSEWKILESMIVFKDSA